MKQLTRKEALQLAHEVACWIIYELETGGFRVSPFRAKCLVSWYMNRDLAGWCWFASVVLAVVLRSRGHDASVAAHKSRQTHGFVVTTCGLVIDPTAMQFGADGPMVRRWRANERFRFCHLFTNRRRWKTHLTSPKSQWAAVRRISRRMGAEVTI